MADIGDIKKMLVEHRKFVTEDGPAPMGIRMYDGITMLLAEMILELREIKEELYTQGARTPDA